MEVRDMCLRRFFLGDLPLLDVCGALRAPGAATATTPYR